MGKRKSSWRKKLAYSFDEYMERGLSAQFGLLLIFFLLVTVIAGGINYLFVEEVSLGQGLWLSLMHIIDQGTLGGDEMSNAKYLGLMLLVTLCGMVLTGSLVAIITNALDKRLRELRQGHSEVLEENHTVVIGFDDNIYCLLAELVQGNKDAGRRQAVVVIDEEHDKETMDRLIREHIVTDQRTKIICRSGKLTQKNIYDQIALCKAVAVIVNRKNDFQALRILLAVTTYLHNRGIHDTIITALLQEQKSIESAKYVVAQFPKARILYFKDMLARIIAQVCRQPGLSAVLTQVFGYAGSEFYIESIDAQGQSLDFQGAEFGDILQRFSNTIVVGIEREERIALNPPPTTPLLAGDKIIQLAVRAHSANLREIPQLQVDANQLAEVKPHQTSVMHFLVLNWNSSLAIVIQVLDQFVNTGSTVRIVSEQDCGAEQLKQFDLLQNIKVQFDLKNDLVSYATLRELLEQEYTNILLMCEENVQAEEADAQAAMLLLHLRTIINNPLCRYKYDDIIITSEMNAVEDQRLLQVVNVHDFVVGSEITNRMMAQVAHEPHLTELFEEILDARGAEIYLRPAKHYIKPGAEMSFDEVASVLYNYVNYEGLRPHEILLGYKYTDAQGQAVVCLNPRANGEILHRFAEEDMLVVLSTGLDTPFMPDFITLGKDLLEQGDYAGARENFTAYITAQLVDREESIGYYWRAVAWQREGNQEQATIDFAKAAHKQRQ